MVRITRPIAWSVEDILEATAGSLVSGPRDRSFAGVGIDSRTSGANSVFMAIKGDTHDGHAFIGDVIAKGCKGIIVSRGAVEDVDVWGDREPGVLIAVEDTRKALGDMAAFNRNRAKVSVVAITGSNGKTTTRNMTTAVVSRQLDTLSAKGNFNNDIGVPLTLLNLSRHHELAVVELGMNHPGEIRYLGRMCAPDIGIITNIGPAHLEGLGSMEAITRAKGELIDEIRPEGTIVLNADDKRLVELARGTRKNVLFFGTHEKAAIRAESIVERPEGLSFTLVLPHGSTDVSLAVPARFMVHNALAAAAAGYLMGLSAPEIAHGLGKFRPVSGRMNIETTATGIHIIDDAYNANPGSMAAAISTLRKLKRGARGILVAGDMYELGDFAASMHKKIGNLAARSHIDRIYAAGAWAEAVSAGAREGGMDAGRIFIGSQEEIISDLTDHLEPGDWVLVKGSRAMKMEAVVLGIRQWADEKNEE